MGASMDDYYHVSLTSAELLASLAALRALDALIAAGSLDTEIEPGILASAADRMAEEAPEFTRDQAERLAGTLAHTLQTGLLGGSAGDEGPADDPPFPTRRTRRLLEDAFERDSAVEIEYFVASRNEWTTRRVDISDVYERDGMWYLSGHCGMRDDFRQFRLDHIRSVRLLDRGESRDPFLEE